MMATPYPNVQYPVGLASTQGPSRNGYRVNAVGQATGAAAYGYQTAQPNVYMPNHSELNMYGLVTPPTSTPSTFSSPLIASGGYLPLPGTPTGQWAVNGMPMMPADGSMGYYGQHSPYFGSDPTCAAPNEVFSTVAGTMRSDSNGSDGIGMFPEHMVGPDGTVFRRDHALMDPMVTGQLGVKPHGHLILGADGQPATEIKKRSRTAQACERCRIRKARCFGGNPCNRCTKRRFVCEFSTAVRQRGPNKPQVNVNAASGASSTGATPTTANSTLSGVPKSVSPGKGGRRHSLPNAPQVPPYATMHGATEDVSHHGANGEDGATFSLPGSGVVPHMSMPDYLTVPTTAPPTQTTFSRPITDSAVYSGLDAQRSPVFAFSPESVEPSTAGTSVDYPYTPISPATAFSPTLAMTPTMPVGMAYAQAHPAEDSNNWYQAA